MLFCKATLLALIPVVIATECSGSFLAFTMNSRTLNQLQVSLHNNTNIAKSDCPLPPDGLNPVEVVNRKETGPASGNFVNTAWSFNIQKKDNCTFFVYPERDQKGQGVRFRDLNS